MKPARFNLAMFGDGLEWTRQLSLTTPAGKYRVTIERRPYHYYLAVWYRCAEPEVCVRWCNAYFDYTAVERGNKLLRVYTKREA
jgi:hypothetical protein